MWLSRLWLDPLAPAQARLLADPYRLHQAVMRGFDGGREANGVLFRIEPEQRDGRVPVLVQSLTEPDWRGFEPEPCRKAFELDVGPGQTLRFRLRANVVKRRAAAADDPLAGKRVAVYDEAQQRQWLAARAGAVGVRWLDVEVSKRGLQHGRKGEHRLTHHAVDFEGHLQVTDPAALCAAVAAGLGPAKAFGFGLLSLAPA